MFFRALLAIRLLRSTHQTLWGLMRFLLFGLIGKNNLIMEEYQEKRLEKTQRTR